MPKRRRQIRRLNKQLESLQGQLGQQGGFGPPGGGFGPPGGGFSPSGGGPQGMSPGLGMQDWMQQGKQAYPGQALWGPNTFQPQGPVDLSPWESGGGGGGGPSYLYDRDLRGKRPPNWDQGGYGGPTDFASLGKRQKRQFRQAYRQGGGKRGGARDAFNQNQFNQQPQNQFGPQDQQWPPMLQTSPMSGYGNPFGFPMREYQGGWLGNGYPGGGGGFGGHSSGGSGGY